MTAPDLTGPDLYTPPVLPPVIPGVATAAPSAPELATVAAPAERPFTAGELATFGYDDPSSGHHVAGTALVLGVFDRDDKDGTTTAMVRLFPLPETGLALPASDVTHIE
jgi:hypothetical protein